jgi:MFS family permease
MITPFQNKKDRSLFYLHGEAASSNIENAGITYQAPALLAAGGNARDIAYLSSATNLLFALLLFKVPTFLRSSDALKKATIILTAISALGWIPLILVPLLVPHVPVAVLIGLWVFNLTPGFLAIPIHDKWMADLIPVRRMGSYFGFRQIVSASAYLATFYLLGYLMDYYGGSRNHIYSLVFSIAFAGCLISLVMYLMVRQSNENNQEYGGKFGFLDFLYDSRQNNMSTFIMYVTLVTFAASISGSFFSVYMLQNLHFNYLTYALIVSIEYIARIVSLTVWGKIVDNAGAIKLLKIISFVIPVIPVLWLFSSNLFYLGMVQFISGISWAAFDLCNQTHISSASPESKRLHYIVYQRCVITIASAVGPLLGAYLLSRIFPVFGSPLLSIFLLSGAIRLIVVVSLVFKLKSADSVRMNENAAPSAVHVIYQAPVEKERVFARYQRQWDGKNAEKSPNRVKPPMDQKFKTEKTDDVKIPGLSPYRQSQYANRRQVMADMLKKPSSAQKENQNVIHRLPRQMGVLGYR